jgi:hypothetical protein
MTIKVNGSEVGGSSGATTVAELTDVGAAGVAVAQSATEAQGLAALDLDADLEDASVTATGLAVLGAANAAAARSAIGAAGPAPVTIEDGGAVVGALTTTLGSGGYNAIRVSGTVRDASGAVIQCRGVLRFSASGAGGAFYNITDYAGTRGTTAPGGAAGVAGVMAGEFDFLTDASGFFDFKVNFTGAGPLVCVWAQCGAAVASTSGTIL